MIAVRVKRGAVGPAEPPMKGFSESPHHGCSLPNFVPLQFLSAFPSDVEEFWRSGKTSASGKGGKLRPNNACPFRQWTELSPKQIGPVWADSAVKLVEDMAMVTRCSFDIEVATLDVHRLASLLSTD